MIEMTEKQLTDLYHAVNEMVLYVASYGTVTTRHNVVADVMDVLANIDGGVYDEKAELTIKLPKDEVQPST